MQGVRVYKVNDEFFQHWNRDMAYVLGFFVADGHLSERSVDFEISQKDVEILKYIKKVTKSEHPIFIKNKYVRFRISSINMVKDLKNIFGLIGNKTFDYKINFNIPKDFVGDFIRGYFDGDGWSHNRRNSVCSGFCSASYGLIKDVHSLINNIGRMRVQYDKRPNRNPLYSIDMDTSDSLKLRDLMYNKEPFCLHRKKERFWNFYIPSKRLWTKEQESFLANNYKLKNSIVAKQLGKTEKSIQMKKIRMRLY